MDVLVEETTVPKEMLSTLHRDNRKDGIRASEQFARLYSLQAQGFKGKFFFKSWGCPVPMVGEARKLFHYDQSPKDSEAAAAMIPESSSTI